MPNNTLQPTGADLNGFKGGRFSKRPRRLN
jgi:hypothetical protein